MTPPPCRLGLAYVHLIEPRTAGVNDQETSDSLAPFHKVFKGTLTYIAPVVTIAEQLSRSLLCKVSIDEGMDKFRHGMSADVTIITDKKEDVAFVPTEALVRDRFAYVVQDGRAVQRDVDTGIGNWDQREILGGLQVGDTIITSISLKALTNGVKVRVVEALED